MTRQIARELYDICYRVEREIVGQGTKMSRFWAKANSLRHAHTVKAILDYAVARELTELKILNASGLSSGHQDFSICNYLRKRYNVDWIAFESPHGPYLASPIFNEMVNELFINCELSDLTDAKQLFGYGFYDVILFTEIAEHLDHPTLLRSLLGVRERLKEDGIIIVTTPNLAYLTNRIKLLLGNGDLHYWGDGTENLSQGLWGHIVYYDLNRLRRLLSDTGLSVVKSYSFNYGNLEPTLFIFLSSLISLVVKNAKQTLFLVAAKHPQVKTPFQI